MKFLIDMNLSTDWLDVFTAMPGAKSSNDPYMARQRREEEGL